ncbi:unnamed protein product [Sphagnum troendelagicum]|uniref:Uncharacterized protein n=1 Tax=Sphagnum troendelagicum TaxID=128251 RepID=A0ABP0TVC6_9BRYO
MQAQILFNGSLLITSSKSKHIALDKLGIRSPDYVLSRTRSSFQGYYYYCYYKPLAGIWTRRVRGRTPRVRASSTANSNEEELENSAAAAAAAAAGAEEVRVKIQVGQVGNCSESVYFFHKIFGASSSIVVVTLPKPLGIVFEESQWRDGNGKCRVVVAGLIPGGNADRASRVAKLFHGGSKLMRNQNQPVFDGDVRPGDILRATTTVGVIVDFLGIRRPQRVIDVYKVDGRPWHLIMRALNASFVADGDVTLVLERRL